MSIETGIASKKRVIAVQYASSAYRENVDKLLADLSTYGLVDDAVVFSASAAEPLQNAHSTVSMPAEKDCNSKQKNFILDWIKGQSFTGFLHIIEQDVQLLASPIDYINKIEHTMDVLDYSVLFSTVTDPCNYLFNKFCQRLAIDIDDEQIQEHLKLPSKIGFTSHANTSWTIHNFADSDVPLKFNESFSIGMFMIIEFLARRRNLKKDGQLFFMNQYLSILEEKGVYSLIDKKDDAIDPKKMQEEDGLFKSMNIDYSPDNNIDAILEAFYAKLQQKMA